jgi:hypothetical protein
VQCHQQQFDALSMPHQIGLEFCHVVLPTQRPLDLEPPIPHSAATASSPQTWLIFLDLLPERVDCILALARCLPQRNNLRMLFSSTSIRLTFNNASSRVKSWEIKARYSAEESPLSRRASMTVETSWRAAMKSPVEKPNPTDIFGIE